MTMPLLPALMGDAEAKPTLADVLSQLDEPQVTELVAAAEAAGFGLAEEEAPPVDDDVLDPELDQPEAPTVDNGEAASEEGVDVPAGGEPAEALEAGEPDDATEEEVTEAAELGFDAISSWTDTALDALDVQYDQLTELAKTAAKAVDAGADPDAIDQLVEKADELRTAANEAAKASAAAAKSEDARTCALEALKIDRASRVLAKLLEQAQAYAETTEAPEVGPADDPAMKLWAERTAPKGGPLL